MALETRVLDETAVHCCATEGDEEGDEEAAARRCGQGGWTPSPEVVGSGSYRCIPGAKPLISITAYE